MKILFFIESLQSGGKERRLIELIKGIKKTTNFECELVLARNEIHFKDIFNTGIKIHILKRNFKKDPRPFFSFFEICKYYKPDVIHVWGNLVAFYAILAKVVLNIPMLNNQITDAPSNVKFSLLNNTIPFYFSNLLIANSYAGLRAYNVDCSKGIVIYNGFDFERIKFLENPENVRVKFNIEDENAVGMVANFTEKKDYKTFIMSALIVLESKPNVTFICIGYGNYYHLYDLIPNKLKRKIRFLEAQDNVENIINTFDVGVLSTFTEGISNSVMEYMALGKPVVVTDGGGSIELVQNNITGYLIPQQSPELLAEKIRYLLENPAIANEMGSKGKEILENKFSISSMINAYLDIYKKLT